MIFASDNWAAAAPEISQALFDASNGTHPAYGGGEEDARLKKKLEEVFEHKLEVFTVATGSAANSLSLSAAQKPGGHVFCHTEAHINVDECTAPDFFMGGGRLVGIHGENGLMDMDNLKHELTRFFPADVHHGQAAAISITQPTEFGTLYSLDRIGEIGDIARAHGLPLHMDGARFANALVALDTSPAEMTWKRGVDILSFGGTKNGCWCAEAIIIFNRDLAQQMPFHHKRAAQLFSKNRFVSAQFNAYLKDDLWLRLAETSNASARMLAEGMANLPDIELAWEREVNMVFAIMKDDLARTLQEKGAAFHPQHTPHNLRDKLAEGHSIYRFVTSFATTKEDITGFLELLG